MKVPYETDKLNAEDNVDFSFGHTPKIYIYFFKSTIVWRHLRRITVSTIHSLQ